MKEFNVPYPLWRTVPNTTNDKYIGYHALISYLERREELEEERKSEMEAGAGKGVPGKGATYSSDVE